jgi:hypothetical protein
MRFHIGPWEYAVEITEEKLVDDEGAECVGLCVWMDNRIQISAGIPRQRRLDVLLHELRHAWRHHLGRSIDDEDDANNAASFTKMCIEELVSQGGEKALMAMEPGEAVGDCRPQDPQDCPPQVSIQTWASGAPGGGFSCAFCQRPFSPGEIITERERFDEKSGKLIVPRAVYCDGCDHVLEWHEGAMFDGSPNGQAIGSVRRMRGRDVIEWLKRHGEQVGIVAV